ncbi:hypothetical protein PYCC9005_005318 [Savitreella phatthalungensis]
MYNGIGPLDMTTDGRPTKIARPSLSLTTGQTHHQNTNRAKRLVQRNMSLNSSVPSLYHDDEEEHLDGDDEEDTDELESNLLPSRGSHEHDDDDITREPCLADDGLAEARRQAWFSSALASAMVESPREVELIKSWRGAIEHGADYDDDHDQTLLDCDRMVTIHELGGDSSDESLSPDDGRKSVSFGTAEVVDGSDYFATAAQPLSRASSISKPCLRSRASSISSNGNHNLTHLRNHPYPGAGPGAGAGAGITDSAFTTIRELPSER